MLLMESEVTPEAGIGGIRMLRVTSTKAILKHAIRMTKLPEGRTSKFKVRHIRCPLKATVTPHDARGNIAEVHANGDSVPQASGEQVAGNLEQVGNHGNGTAPVPDAELRTIHHDILELELGQLWYDMRSSNDWKNVRSEGRRAMESACRHKYKCTLALCQRKIVDQMWNTIRYKIKSKIEEDRERNITN